MSTLNDVLNDNNYDLEHSSIKAQESDKMCCNCQYDSEEMFPKYQSHTCRNSSIIAKAIIQCFIFYLVEKDMLLFKKGETIQVTIVGNFKE
jgi:hypothetical protein